MPARRRNIPQQVRGVIPIDDDNVDAAVVVKIAKGRGPA